jgi:hypothetical protein
VAGADGRKVEAAMAVRHVWERMRKNRWRRKVGSLNVGPPLEVWMPLSFSFGGTRGDSTRRRMESPDPPPEQKRFPKKNGSPKRCFMKEY